MVAGTRSDGVQSGCDTIEIANLWRGAVKGLTGTDIVKTFKVTNTRGNISYQWRDDENEIRIINLE